jgi:uncharacterized protein
MDLTPLIPAGRQIIESYGGGRFRIAGAIHAGSVLIFPERTLAWPVLGFADISLDVLEPVALSGRAGTTDLLLIGCGTNPALLGKDLRAALRASNIVIETMDTGAAARTFNVLMAEGRRVAAALIAVA